MKGNLTAYLQLALSMVFVGSSVIVGKVIATEMPIYLSSAASLLIASIFLIPILLIKEGVPRLGKKDLVLLSMQTLVGTFLYRIFLLYGLKHTGAFESGIITSTGPFVMLVLSVIFLREKFDVGKFLGVLLTIIGVALTHILTSSSDTSDSSNLLIGSMLVFFSVIAESLFSLFAKPTSEQATPLLISTFVSVLGFFMFLPFAIFEISELNSSNLTMTEILSVVYYGIVVTAIAFLLWFKGLKKVDASIAGVFMGFIPLTSTVLSVILLGESLSSVDIIGSIFIIFGIITISKYSN